MKEVSLFVYLVYLKIDYFQSSWKDNKMERWKGESVERLKDSWIQQDRWIEDYKDNQIARNQNGKMEGQL